MNDSKLILSQQPMQILYEDEMEMDSTSERGMVAKSDKLAGPRVTLGEPQSWDLLELCNKQKLVMPPEMMVLSRDARFYLVKLAITFHPQKDTHITWAQFAAYLRPEKAGHSNPIAFDLYPKEIHEESKTNLKLGISPEIKFSEVEFKLGEVSALFDYRNFAPVTTGFGLLESNPMWEFKHHKLHPLHGSRECYLIVKKPRDCHGVRVTLDAMLEVSWLDQIFSARRKQTHGTHCSQIICKDG